MASVRVGQFHARDAEGRVYPVHEFQESPSRDAGDQEPVTTYRLAIGDRVTHLGGDDFELVQSGVRMTRIRDALSDAPQTSVGSGLGKD